MCEYVANLMTNGWDVFPEGGKVARYHCHKGAQVERWEYNSKDDKWAKL
jgi:hypothetical protein